MATLLLPAADPAAPSSVFAGTQPLSEWLGDDWALLLSHPADFSCDDFESDRWLAIVHDAFLERGVRPVALCRPPAPPDRGWVSQVICDQALLTLTGCSQRAAAASLSLLLENMQGHYAFIIDAQLECRGIEKCRRSNVERLSPLDLLGAVDRLRQAQHFQPLLEYDIHRHGLGH